MQEIDLPAALAHLRATDPVMAGIIDLCGEVGLRDRGTSPFQSLARAIIFQQISGAAANAIYRKFLGLFELEGDAFPAPEQVVALQEEQLRLGGLSRQKAASIRDLALHFASGELGSEQFGHWTNEDIIAHLVRVRGVGRWTAEMFLIFHLRRPDVLPVNDVGINRAIMRRYGLPAMPKPAEVLRIGAPWQPHATVACLYLWASEAVTTP